MEVIDMEWKFVDFVETYIIDPIDSGKKNFRNYLGYMLLSIYGRKYDKFTGRKYFFKNED